MKWRDGKLVLKITDDTRVGVFFDRSDASILHLNMFWTSHFTLLCLALPLSFLKFHSIRGGWKGEEKGKKIDWRDSNADRKLIARFVIHWVWIS